MRGQLGELRPHAAGRPACRITVSTAFSCLVTGSRMVRVRLAGDLGGTQVTQDLPGRLVVGERVVEGGLVLGELQVLAAPLGLPHLA